MKGLEVKTVNNEYVEVIDRCLTHLRIGNGSENDRQNWSGIIINAIINHIRLGHGDVSTRLEMLNKIFDDRSFLVYKDADEHIRLGYEDLLQKQNDSDTQMDIQSRIEQLQSK